MPRNVTAAAHGPFSGAVVTLLPTLEDAERLVVDGFEPPDELHVTLAWLGDTDGDPAPAVGFDDAVEAIRGTLATDGTTPIAAELFGVALFNPASEDRDPATVLLAQSPDLADVRSLVVAAVGDASSFPVWFPHLTLGYQLGNLDPDDAAARMGPVTFDRIRISYGSEQTHEINLGGATMSTKPHRVRVITPAGTFRGTAACVPCSQGFADDLVLPEPVDVGTTAQVEPGSRWEGVLMVEGTPTGDGRMFEAGSIRWSDLPIPLRWVREDVGEHAGAVVVGRILEVWRDGPQIRARGDFDAASDDGREAARQVAEALTRGVSVDVDDVDMEIRVASEVLEDMEQEIAVMIGEEEPDTEEERQVDGDGRVTVHEFHADDELMVMTDARLRAATIVATPAFVEAQLRMDDREDTPVDGSPDDGLEDLTDPEIDELVAGAVPTSPPSAWFKDPKLTVATPVTITEDGRIFGHLAAWGTCHTAYAHECVTPPASASSYAYFRTGAVRADEGTTVPTGRITLDTTHAARRLGAADTAAHYEHTGMAVADVAAGEDAHGIWIAGALRSGVTDEQIRALRGSPLSGDWRRIGGALELVAALAVNSPGFPIPRALVAGGAVQALQSSGVVDPDDHVETAVGPTDDDRLLARMMERERRDEQERRQAAEDARSRVLVASAVAKVRGR